MKRFSNPYIHLVSLSWHFAESHRRGFLVFYALFIAANIALLGLPYLLGKIFDTLQRQPADMMQELLLWTAIYAALNFIFWGLHGPARVIERKIAFHIKQRFVDDMYRMVKELPMKWHQDHHSGDTINRINKASTSLYEFSQTQFEYITFILTFIGPLVVLAFIAPLVALLALISGVATALVIRRYDQKRVPLLVQENELEHHFSSAFFDYVSNITTIISLRIGERTRAELRRRMEMIFPVLQRSILINEWKWFALTFCRIAIEVVILLFYIWLETRHNTALMVGSAVMVYQYLRRLSEVAVGFAQKYEMVIRWRTNYDSALFIQRAHAQQPPRPNIDDIRNWQRIRIENLRFSYHDQEHHLHSMKDVSVAMHRGRRIALVGASGAGKSTLLGLLRGIFEAQGGEVYVDDETQPRCMNVIPQLVTLIPQDPEIFENTIRYNITTGMEHTDEELREDMEAACFTPVLKRMEQGAETDIREKGVNLSGGEKQRLALARGIFAARTSSILLLDEPTSSIDSVTERRIYANLFRMFKDCAIISSIHRLHLLEQFDWIYVMESGAVIEQGTLNDLLAAGGKFTGMWNEYHKKDGGE